MAKFYGKIGYVKQTESTPGVWENSSTEKIYSGELLQNTMRQQNGGNINDDINISNKISILADSFANENFSFMSYVVFMGAKWKITNIEIMYPRLIIAIGGLYHE